MPNFYSDGTIKVVNGSKDAVLTAALAITSTMKPGDRIVVDGLSDFENSIGLLDQFDPSKFTFATEWAGPSGEGLKFVVTHMPIGWGDRIELAEGVAEDIRLLKAGQITSVNVATRAELFADLGWPNDSLGKVFDDPSNRDFEGVYKKIGNPGEGSWERIGPLPERADLNAYLIGQTAAIAANAAAIIELRNEIQDF